MQLIHHELTISIPALPAAGLVADEVDGGGGGLGEAGDGSAHGRVGGAGDHAGREAGGQLLGNWVYTRIKTRFQGTDRTR